MLARFLVDHLYSQVIFSKQDFLSNTKSENQLRNQKTSYTPGNDQKKTSQGGWEDDGNPYHRWDMLVPWRVNSLDFDFHPSKKYAQVKLDHFLRDRSENQRYSSCHNPDSMCDLLISFSRFDHLFKNLKKSHVFSHHHPPRHFLHKIGDEKHPLCPCLFISCQKN